MSFKKVITGIIGLLALVTGFAAQQALAQPGMGMARVVVILSADSDVARADLYINGDAKGSIRRGDEVRHVVPFGSGKEAVIEVRSGEFREQQRVVLYSNRWTRVTFTLKTVRQGAINVKYASESRYSNATIEIDGSGKGRIRRGESRTFDNLDPKEYTVKLSAGNVSMERRVTVHAGRTTDVEFNLQPPQGTLKITYSGDSAFRRARMTIDGQNKGNIQRGETRTVPNVDAGQHTIQLSSNNATMDRVVTVRSGETVEVAFTLQPPKGTLRVQYTRDSAYPNAKIFINDQEKGRIRRGQNSTFELAPGEYTVKVEGGRESMVRTLTITSGNETEAAFTLKAIGIARVQLRRDSVVEKAQLYINGNLVREITRGQNYDIRVDGNTTHTIEVRSGEERMSRRVVRFRTDTIDVVFGLY